MSCTNTITLFKPGTGYEWNESKRAWGGWQAFPCGQCSWCRFVRTRQWALRIYLENQFINSESAFLTLTYSNEHLPKNNTLVKKDLQDFLKRLRSNLEYQQPGKKIRFYAVGEYGEENDRPHYHVIIFGYSFPEKTFWNRSPKGHLLYRSAFLEKCWKLGFSDIGDVSLNSASYTAGYIRKKINGALAESHYNGREPEFSLQSSVPGIGAAWYHANKKWLWKEDIIQCNGRGYRPPRYFEKLLKQEDPLAYDDLQIRKSKRLPFTRLNAPNQAEDIALEPGDDIEDDI